MPQHYFNFIIYRIGSGYFSYLQFDIYNFTRFGLNSNENFKCLKLRFIKSYKDLLLIKFMLNLYEITGIKTNCLKLRDYNIQKFVKIRVDTNEYSTKCNSLICKCVCLLCIVVCRCLLMQQSYL